MKHHKNVFFCDNVSGQVVCANQMYSGTHICEMRDN